MPKRLGSAEVIRVLHEHGFFFVTQRRQACSHPRSSRREEALTIPQRSTWRVAEFSQSLVTSAATFHLAFIHHDAMQEQRARVVYSNT